DPLCVRLIVEDDFMREWMTRELNVAADKISLLPNSFDLDLYRLPGPRLTREKIVILAIARFVEKKGLAYLVQAFHQLCAGRANVELRLVGYGPEESELRRAAGETARIRFLGPMSEAETRRAYSDADIFCLPCIQTATGDADGIPTTVLEAMAFELPVVGTHLLSTPCYVRDGQEGFLVAPRDAAALSVALERLCADAALRAEMGRAGRARISEICDLKRNVRRLAELIRQGRMLNRGAKLKELEGQRQSYTRARENFYTECRTRAAAYFQASAGKLLEIGCGSGSFRLHLPAAVEYYGCDALMDEEARGAFPFAVARAESLPFRDHSFDAVLFYAALIHLFDVDRALAEAARILKPGGLLYLQECYDDPNPLHLNHFSGASLQRRISEHFNVLRFSPANDYLMMMVAGKPTAARNDDESSAQLKAAPALEPRALPALEERSSEQQLAELQSNLPLVSICIATYNRAEFVGSSIDSVLRQTYRNVEVVVIDDGSSDDTRRLLESYGASIRVAYNDGNRGIAFSKNRALTFSASTARYVGILDSDDYYHPQFVERCVQFLESRTDVGLVYTDDIMVDVNGRELWRQPSIEPWDVDKWLRTRNLRGDTWLAHRALVMKTNLHDEETELDVDYDLFYQLLQITTFAHLPEFLVFIRQHGGRNTAANHLALTRAHAANLVKYGYSPEYAYLRARGHPEWIPAIEEGVRLGRQIYEQRLLPARQSEVAKSENSKRGNSNGHVRLAIAGGEPVRSSFLP
ncbi:MAG TPA: glycosyltransferase, partial [Pyrinomonadaceae bacterium]